MVKGGEAEREKPEAGTEEDDASYSCNVGVPVAAVSNQDESNDERADAGKHASASHCDSG